MDFFSTINPQAAQQQQQQQQQALSKTIFVGNLSIYCSETELAEIFTTFGKIESIHLKKKEQGNLSYCFVKFHQRSSAEFAIASLNGNILHGRPLRLGWAVEYEDGTPIMKKETIVKAAPPPHAQIHVSFHAVLAQPVTESMIRTIFSRFGEVKDVSIKKIQFNRDTHQQSGYGFVHYGLDKEGIAAALQATETMNGNESNSIAFHCSVSHGLTRYIQANPHLNPKPSNVMIHYLAPSSSQAAAAAPPLMTSMAPAVPAAIGGGAGGRYPQMRSQFPPQDLSNSFFPSGHQQQSYFPRHNANFMPSAGLYEDFDAPYAPSLQTFAQAQPRSDRGMYFPASFPSSSALSNSSGEKSLASSDYSMPSEEILSRQFY